MIVKISIKLIFQQFLDQERNQKSWHSWLSDHNSKNHLICCDAFLILSSKIKIVYWDLVQVIDHVLIVNRDYSQHHSQPKNIENFCFCQLTLSLYSFLWTEILILRSLYRYVLFLVSILEPTMLEGLNLDFLCLKRIIINCFQNVNNLLFALDEFILYNY